MKLAGVSTRVFAQAVAQAPTVIIPVGSIEAHGRHCPLGTDLLIPARIADEVEARLSDSVWVAPPISYGHSWELSVFPGTINVSSETFTAYVADVGRGLAAWGLKNVLLLNGHGGNIAGLTLAAERIADAGARVAVINWWLDYAADILKHASGQGHAGEDETSVVLAIDARLVDMSLAGAHHAKPPLRFKQREVARLLYPEALSGDATLATAEKGSKILDAVVVRVIEAVQYLAGLTPLT